MSIEYIVANISFGSVLVPLAAAALNWRDKQLVPRILTWLVIISLTTDLVSYGMMKYQKNTHLVGNIYLVLQFALLFRLYASVYSRRWMLALFAGAVITFAINLLFFQGPWRFNSISSSIASIVLVALCLHYFYRLLAELPSVHIHKQPMLWVSFAVLTYYAGNFFLILLGDYLLEEAQASYRTLWILHNLLNIIKNILFAIALWQSYLSRKSSLLS